MCEKTLRVIEQVQEILRNGYLEPEAAVLQAKMDHACQRIESLRDLAINIHKEHQTELRANHKEIKKLRKRAEDAEKELQERSFREKKSRKDDSCGFKKFMPDEEEAQVESLRLEREKSKKLQAQERNRELKEEIERMQAQLSRYQNQNKALRQQVQDQHILLEEFIRQESTLSESSSAENESQSSRSSLRHYFQQQNIMREDEELLKPEEDRETDDQEQEPEPSSLSSIVKSTTSTLSQLVEKPKEMLLRIPGQVGVTRLQQEPGPQQEIAATEQKEERRKGGIKEWVRGWLWPTSDN